MNTVTLQETQALQAAVTAPAVEAIVTATYRLLLIPLSQLRPSSRNVRQSGGASIPELASSIARVGLLQNLTVTASSDGEHYEVVAGKRRLAALKLLAKRHKIDKAHDVPCLLVPDASARTVSLTENVQREPMHPGEQFEAFAALVAEGRPIEDIAADFGVTPLVVQRRLKLANVSPRLLTDYRADVVTLERGRSLLAWQQCRRLAHGELFLLSNTNPASFDSRYFGPIRVSEVIGSAQPIWTWSTP